jgi:phosphoribosylaminoimidazole-succinocarboxamide synthase
MQVVSQTNIVEYPLLSRGKVRDIYEISDSVLLIVTTDRMSAFDVIMNEPIPFKGVVLNQITLFWMQKFQHLIKNHLLEWDIERFPEPLRGYSSMLRGRSVLVRRANPLPVECIVRGNITGSGWKDYKATGMVSGHCLPAGLKESERLPQPLFTPSTKAELGQHDENITRDQAMRAVGKDVFHTIEDTSLAIFSEARDYAAERGIIIADTKFEFGLVNGEVYLIDEVLTPDSSRFWPQSEFEPGRSQPSFDKQYLRDWLETQNWGKTPPPPTLPSDVIEETARKYMQAYSLLTGKEIVL